MKEGAHVDLKVKPARDDPLIIHQVNRRMREGRREQGTGNKEQGREKRKGRREKGEWKENQTFNMTRTSYH